MSNGLRLTERWLNCGLWLVALVFAGFLIGLGGKLVENLADAEDLPTVEQFIEPTRLAELHLQESQAEALHKLAKQGLEQAVEKHSVAKANTTSARASFEDWLATRSVTQRADQDHELISRTKSIEALEAEERSALAAVEGQRQALLDATQQAENAQQRRHDLESPAQRKVQETTLRWTCACSAIASR